MQYIRRDVMENSRLRNGVRLSLPVAPARPRRVDLCHCASYKLQSQVNLVSSSVPPLFTTNAESPSMKKIIRYIDQLTNRIIPNRSAQRRARRQVPPYPNAFLLSPSFPGSPIPENSRPRGSPINHACYWIVTNRGPTRPSRCTSFARLPVTTAD